MKRLVVIPTLGRSPWLDAAVASARALGERWRLRLVGPAAVGAAIRERFPDCDFVAESGAGLFRALNDALHADDAWEWFSYLNDDDLVAPAAGWEPPAGADIVYGRVDYLAADGRRLGSFPVEPKPPRLGRLLAAGVPALTPQGTVVSRRAFAALGGFDPGLKFCGDFDFWLRAARKNLDFRFRAETTGAFRVRPGQLSAQRAAADAERDAVCARHGGGYSGASLVLARLTFRLRNAGRILERRRLTGRWTSAALFSGDIR